ncbi:hypothetical protein CC2G_010048 [Coprinopsis cinerea AmutBmut pab1-1]|nr:hypothetical protein CC2G_010048 [Coprinopsis cinerea AmutBmut pab1-1]
MGIPHSENLTSLTLANPLQQAHFHVNIPLPSLDQLLTVLENNTKLRQLNLVVPLPNAWGNWGKEVALCHLETLSFFASFTNFTALFNHISFPQSTTLYLIIDPSQLAATTDLEAKATLHEFAASLSRAWSRILPAKTPLGEGPGSTGPAYLMLFSSLGDHALPWKKQAVIADRGSGKTNHNATGGLHLHFIGPFLRLLPYLLSTPLFSTIEYLYTTEMDEGLVSMLDQTQSHLKSIAIPCQKMWVLLAYARSNPRCLPSIEHMWLNDVDAAGSILGVPGSSEGDGKGNCKVNASSSWRDCRRTAKPPRG